MLGAVSRHSLSHQLLVSRANSRANSESFPGGADYPSDILGFHTYLQQGLLNAG